LKATAVLLALALPLWGVVDAQDADRARIEAQSRRAAARLQALNAEAERLAREARTLIGDLRKLEIERQVKAEELRQADDAMKAAAAELSKVDNEVRRLETEAQAELPALRARLVELYKRGSGRYARLLLSTTDAQRIGQASRTIAALAKRDRDRMVSHQKRLSDLAASRSALEARGRELGAVRSAAERARAAADRAVRDRNGLIGDIDRRRDLTAQLSGELLAAQQELQKRLTGVATTPGGVAPPLPLKPFRGALEWPAAGAIRQRFGGPAGPGRPPANGIEIAVAEGTPVRAVHDGTVAFAGPYTGFGTLVIVDHGAQAFSLYGSLLQADVTQGTRLDRGDPVGLSGSAITGVPGLYFELRVDGRPVDPLQWLKR
jgi:septal ring factor EnvC (AmiA/AmiB activator)